MNFYVHTMYYNAYYKLLCICIMYYYVCYV